MNDREFIDALRRGLNEEGAPWNLHFTVSDEFIPDLVWFQIFYRSDATRQKAAAERENFADVESDLSVISGKELLPMQALGVEAA
jgi:hypothetical protein